MCIDKKIAEECLGQVVSGHLKKISSLYGGLRSFNGQSLYMCSKLNGCAQDLVRID